MLGAARLAARSSSLRILRNRSLNQIERTSIDYCKCGVRRRQSTGKPPNSSDSNSKSSSLNSTATGNGGHSAKSAATGGKEGAESEGGGVADHMRLEQLGAVYKDMEAKLMKNLRTHSKGQARAAILGTILLLIWVPVTFGTQIRKFVGGQTAEVAIETLAHESLQIQTQQLATAVVNTLLTDGDVLSGASLFFHNAAKDPETQAALISLASHVLQHKDTLDSARKLAKDVVVLLASDPETIGTLVSLTTTVLNDARTKATIVKLIGELSQDQEVYDAVVDLSSRVLAHPQVAAQVSEMLSASTHSVLSDDHVFQHSKEFVVEVLNDESLQQSGGDALWRSVKYAFKTRVVVASCIGAACVGAAFLFGGDKG